MKGHKITVERRGYALEGVYNGRGFSETWREGNVNVPLRVLNGLEIPEKCARHYSRENGFEVYKILLYGEEQKPVLAEIRRSHDGSVDISVRGFGKERRNLMGRLVDYLDLSPSEIDEIGKERFEEMFGNSAYDLSNLVELSSPLNEPTSKTWGRIQKARLSVANGVLPEDAMHEALAT
ncbi:MAG: hypothetical protein AABW89_04750 [Nanoarchaeota archaeon]